MQFVFLGPPGSGKGTQSALIIEKYKIPHVSTGDIFRKAIAEQSPLGLEAQKYIAKGELVPDDITIELLLRRINQDDCKNGFLLDGFPRTIPQAEALDLHGKRINRPIQLVLNMVIEETLLLNRVDGRRVCKECNTSFNLKSKPPINPGICDRCECELYQRSDDNPESIKTRLHQHRTKTSPLLEYYIKKGTLVANIDSLRDIPTVFKEIDSYLEKIK
jgi:adenylate kinase